MKSFDTDIQKHAQKVRLTASERRDLRERLLSYMEYHPLKEQAGARRATVPGIVLEQPFSIFHIHVSSLAFRIAGAVCALVLIAVPFAAERSVPGDVLYVVKTGVNETFQGQLASSPYEKIEFETKLMERRITEARVLASEGKLTEEVKTQITETVKEHTSAVQQGLADLREQDADGAAIAEIAFNTSLEVQSAVLGADENIVDTSLTENILTVVNDARETVVSNQETNVPSYESLRAQVERETTRAYELFAVIKESATDEENSDIDRRLSDINRLTLEADELHATNPGVAAENLTATLGLAQKLIVFMTDIDVQETVTLEALVPVMLSDEERALAVREEATVLATLQEEIMVRLETFEDADIRLKAEDGIAQITELMLQVGVALETGEIPAAETAVREARALMTDVDVMTQVAEEVPVEEVPTEPTGEGDTGTTTPTGEPGTEGTTTPATPEMPETPETGA